MPDISRKKPAPIPNPPTSRFADKLGKKANEILARKRRKISFAPPSTDIAIVIEAVSRFAPRRTTTSPPASGTRVLTPYEPKPWGTACTGEGGKVFSEACLKQIIWGMTH